MKHTKTLIVAAALLGGSAISAQAQELHMIMCGEARPADQVVIDQFQADNPGVTVNQERDYQPLPAGLFEFIGYQTTTWNEMMAAALVGVLPVMVIFLFLQKYLVAGLTAGAIKE